MLKRLASCWRHWNRQVSSRGLAAALVAAGLLLVAGPVIPQSSDAPQARSPEDQATDEVLETGLVERAEVTLSLLEVVVLDRKGRHVRGLSRDDFRLREGQREVELLTFDEIDLARPAGEIAVAGESTPAPPTEDEPTPVATEGPDTLARASESAAAAAVRQRMQKPRWFVLLFDGYNNPSPLKISQVRRAAKSWILQAFRPGDRAAVYEMTPFLSSLTGFSTDAYELHKAIDSVRIFPASEDGLEFMRQRMEQALPNIPREFLENQLRNSATFGQDLLSRERDQFYMNLSNVAAVLAPLEGTKAIVLFSGGFPITRSRATNASGGFTARFRQMLKTFESLGVRVFSFDVGEDGGFTDADEAMNFGMLVDNLGLGTDWLDRMQIGAAIDSVNAHQEILSVVGSESGGRFLRGKNYAAGLDAVNDDLSHYYLIGYAPEDLRRTGKQYVPLKVELADSKLRAIARTGRFAESPLEDAPAQPAAGPPDDTVAVTTEPASLDGQPLELRCRPVFFPGPAGKTLAVLPLRVQGPIEPTSLGEDGLALDLSIDLSASSGGQPVVEGDRTVRARLKAGASGALAAGFHVREAMLLPPAVLDLEIELRINGQNRSGTWRERVQVPPMPRDTFGLTGLALLSPLDRSLKMYDVFTRGEFVHGTEPGAPLPDPLGAESAVRPEAYLGGPFPRNVPLLAQVGVLAPPRAQAEGESPLRMDWELVPASGGEPTAPPIRYRRLQLVEGGRMLDVIVDLELTEVPEGDYRLRLTTRNLISRETAVRSVPITLSR